ncbi:MAG: pyridoxal phosphate-dependent aminotransferase [Brevinema sp.]
MTFSHFADKLSMASAIKKQQMLAEAQAEGREVIDLSLAEPDFEPPYQLIDAFERALRDKDLNKYTSTCGIEILRERFAQWATVDYGFSVGVENVSTTTGARGGIAAVIQALLNPNDEVILPAPFWNGYTNIIKLVGAIPKMLNLDEEEAFHPTIDQLNRIYSPKTKMIILNNPHNPTGVIWGKETLKEILEWAEKKNVFVLVDEVCMVDVFDGIDFHSMAKVRGSFKNLAIVRAFSKTLGIPGWRVGWVMAEPDLIGKIDAIQCCTNGGIHSIAQYALDASWDALEPWIKQQNIINQHRRDVLFNHLSKLHGFRTQKPQGGVCAFSNIQYYLGNEVGGEVPQTAQDFVEIVFRKTGVLLSGGESLGKEGFVRACFTQNEENLSTAINKIATILEK